MKKILILVITFTLSLIILTKNDAYAYTISGASSTYYNQITDSVGQSDLLDISSTMIEYMYYDLGANIISTTSTIRVVFSNIITTDILPILTPNLQTRAQIDISFYTSSHIQIYTNTSYYNVARTLTYFETNFVSNENSELLDYIIIKISNLSPYDELVAHENMNSAIIVSGSSMIINQTIQATQYNNGWSDAMSSKVTQIWSLWGNIFNTFMSVFDVFSITLVGDITIGHLALVPLVLGLIGFIYALGGKRGR